MLLIMGSQKSLCYNGDMKKKSRGGFTLIEMSLSLVFIGILSVFMVLMIRNTTASYRRGLILNQLNTVGMDLIDDVRTSIQEASTDSIYRLCERIYGTGTNACTSDNGDRFVRVTKTAEVKIDGTSIGTLPVYGAFCTGTYTYIWNSGYLEAAGYEQNIEVNGVSRVTLKNSAGTDINTDFRLLKIYDRERTVCRNANNAQNVGGDTAYVTDPDNNRVPSTFIIDTSMLSGGVTSDQNSEGGVELLKQNTVNDLVLYDFYMTRPAVSGTRQNLFFAGSFILGTRKGGVNITVGGNSCKPPSEDYSNLEYCSINKFNFAVQAGGS